MVSSPVTARAFLLNHFRELSRTCDLTLVANTADFGFLKAAGLGLPGLSVAIERPVALGADLAALYRLSTHLRRGSFDAVHSITPKAGLLAMAAARLARVPVRIHWFTGQVWVTRSGSRRLLLKKLDQVTATFATHLLVDSPSQMAFLASEGVAPSAKMRVLGSGSVCGVDISRFRRDVTWRTEMRCRLNVPEAATLFAFLGRCTIDKGLMDLARAFNELCARRDDCYLVVAGPDEDGVLPEMLQFCGSARDRVRRLDYVDATERVLAAADVLCLPSYREGFGSVILEAAAAGAPSVGSRIYGIVDAIEDGVTGLLHEPRDPRDLCKKMLRLAEEPALRVSLGHRAQVRATAKFQQAMLTAALVDYYHEVIPTN